MKLLVFIKQVPDKNARLVLDGSNRGIVETDLAWEVNESDRYALETGLRLKEAAGGGEVVACTLGPERARKALSSALAMGCDRGVHLVDPDYQGGDPIATARALAGVARGEQPDLILAGTRSDDAGYGETAMLVAGLLDVPAVFLAIGVELAGEGRLRVIRELERSRQEVLEIPTPALLGIQSGIHDVRYTSLKGIMAAKKKPVGTPTLVDLDMSLEQVGFSGSRLETLDMAPPSKSSQCRFIDGEAAEAARSLVDLLKREAKVL